MDDAERQLWKTIGSRIRHFRRSQRMSVDALASRVGVVRQQIVRLEAGLVGTTLPRLLQIADALGVALGDLLQGVRTEPTSPLDSMVLYFRDRGLSEDEIRKILDYIQLIERARDHNSHS